MSEELNPGEVRRFDPSTDFTSMDQSPAVLFNRFSISANPSLVRVAFGEQIMGLIHPRGAVVGSTEDLRQLADTIQKLLAEIEKGASTDVY